MPTDSGRHARKKELLEIPAMSEEQLSAFLAKIKQDTGLEEKLKGASDLDAVARIAQEAGFDVSQADLLKNKVQKSDELSDDELEGVSGGAPQCSYAPKYLSFCW